MTLFDRIQAIAFTWRDGIDIILVSLIIYYILVLIRGTRAMQMSIGLMVLGGIYFFSRALDLIALQALTEAILLYLPIAIIVLFQHEIRRGLTSVGRNPLVRMFSRREVPYFEGIVRAASELAANRIGALIAIERTETLRPYVETGKAVDAVLSDVLLLNIFVPNTPLHDGAVIVQGNRIAAAGTFLPLTASTEMAIRHGTRHRAALGLSEETDAFVVVVSEENGAIAVAIEGKLLEDVSPARLRELMERYLQPSEKEKDEGSADLE